MPAKLIAQLASLGILGSSAYVSTIIDIADSPLPKQEKAPEFKLKQFPNFPKEAKDVTIEDIELYEASGKCRFVFVDRSGKKQIFKAREWFEQKIKQKPSEEKWWRSRITYDVFYERFKCQNGQQLILELGDGVHGSFKPKAGL